MGSSYDYQEGLLGAIPGMVFGAVVIIAAVNYVVEKVKHK